ncbi:hypothetical protein CCMA1212_001756 [Trichoderma ghanense]|uniref:Uncharacterized protein n=1 Tax=Trichoderma ghanense TaxID=65468 RepID=A0ABY2HDZ2_9HYPO
MPCHAMRREKSARRGQGATHTAAVAGEIQLLVHPSTQNRNQRPSGRAPMQARATPPVAKVQGQSAAAENLDAASARVPMQYRHQLVPLVLVVDCEPSVQPAASRSRETSRGWRSRGAIFDVL